MQKYLKATKIKGVEQVLTLRKNGVSLKNARIIVANDLKISVSRLTGWMREHTSAKTTKTNNVVVSQRSESTRGLNDLNDVVFDTIEDLKEGRITHKEACAMSSLAGTITNIKKLQFAAHKYVSKASSQSITVDKLLGQ